MRKGLTALTVAVLAGLTVATASQSPEQEAAREWFLQIQQQAYEAVMPLTVPDRLVAYRVSHEIDPDDHERYFAIQYMRLGEGYVFPYALTATIVQPLGSSIQSQLINLRTKDRAVSVAELASRLTLRKATVDIDHCKAIRSQVSRLSGVRVTLPRRDIITLDAPVHEIAVNIGHLAMTATIEDSKAPLVEWAVRTHELLLRCLPSR